MRPPPGRRALRALPSGPAARDDVVDAQIVEPTDLAASRVPDRLAAWAAGARSPAAWGRGTREPTLAAAVEAMLASLGADRHHVAQTLSAAGVRGWPGNPDMDPLCRWLHREIPDAGVWLADGWLRVWRHHPDGRRDQTDVSLPRPVADYANAARAGAYPHLRLPYAPPMVPVPHVDLGAGTPEPPWWDHTDVAPGPTADPTPPAGGAAAGPTPAPPTVGGVRSAGREPPPVAGDPAAGDRRLAHEAYGDAVAVALDLRGVPVLEHSAWPAAFAGSPALREEGRRITITLDPEPWAQVLPDAAAVYLHWSERHGWSLVSVKPDGHADPDATLSWWDWSAPHAVLPAPPRLASWVIAAADVGDVSGRLPGAGLAVGERPFWRDASDTDPAFEGLLDRYRTSTGHRMAARDRHDDARADTVVLTAVRAGDQEPPVA
ncbi:DUF6292 family protein [Micromonospora thermarum]|uniref:Uncharacterized protein n=1 Tax=Micromonospora thermarum TaxID=2720024 RepID=A0ABX0Z9R5_9ACTN|nr:DUF6292 family protein [Micromonospora thermarum]NJP33719.1 hypothetical protein [Micromonospora thermarum]